MVQEFTDVSIVNQTMNVVLISSRKPLHQLGGIQEIKDPYLGSYYVLGKRIFHSVSFTGHSGSCHIYRALEVNFQNAPIAILAQINPRLLTFTFQPYVKRWI